MPKYYDIQPLFSKLSLFFDNDDEIKELIENFNYVISQKTSNKPSDFEDEIFERNLLKLKNKFNSYIDDNFNKKFKTMK